MNFGIYGPYEIPRSNRLVDTAAPSKKKFWDDVGGSEPGLPDACGCYIFVVKAKSAARFRGTLALPRSAHSDTKRLAPTKWITTTRPWARRLGWSRCSSYSPNWPHWAGSPNLPATLIRTLSSLKHLCSASPLPAIKDSATRETQGF